MLSIGKLAAGQERYYEQQVAQGLDDYFTGRGESPGRWMGAGAARLGLGGSVEDGQLALLMAGRDPATGAMLREQSVRVAALDLTFSAPKSVSVLYAVAGDQVSVALSDCHEHAVQAALEYLEQTAALVSRRTGDGLRLHQAGGFVTAAFRHRMSRALDPQLHTHCVSANLAQGPDGRWTALHHPTLFAAAQTAGYLYQAHLRALVSGRLGLEWGLVYKGAAELVGVDALVLEEFSTRRHEMRRAAQEGRIGLGSRAASQAAALATRSRKQFGIDTGPWREEVRARAAEHGLTRAQVDRLERIALRTLAGGDRVVQAREEDAERVLFDRLAGPGGLTELANTFDTRAVLRALAQDAQQGAQIAALRAQGRRFAARQDVVRTVRGGLTTAELVGVERRLIAAAHGRAGEGSGRVELSAARAAIDRCGQWLNAGQRAAVEATVSSGHGVQVIQALAGTGKTYTAGVLRIVYEQAGYQVLGVAPTGRAVRELAEVAQIPSRTLDSLTTSIALGYQLPAGGVVVLDEAGMAATRQTAVLLEAAQRAGCKVIAIGDPGQLSSVQAGGWMHAVGRRVGILRLSEVMRQRDPAERRALAALHDGQPQAWLNWAREHDRVSAGAAGELADQAVAQWHAAALEHGLRAAVLIARDNDMRHALNDRARALLAHHGALGEAHTYGPVIVAVGERVICRRNDRVVDVDNGTRGTVRAADAGRVVIETDAGTIRSLPAAYVAQHVEYAYALTAHGMQGGTVERAFVLAAPHELTKGWSYTALSRARNHTRLFILTDSHDTAREELAPAERHQTPTEDELFARVQRYMTTRDDEDLAIEQLRAPTHTTRETLAAASDSIPRAMASSAADCGPRPPASADGLRASQQRLETLQAQLQALETPEVMRLEAAERREQQLIAHQDELLNRAQRVPDQPRLTLRPDHHQHQRTNLQHALAGVGAELHALRTVRDRLTRELGEPDQIRTERAHLQSAIARATAERDLLTRQFVARELAGPPVWAMEALGPRPHLARERELWDRAARGLARYRIQHNITHEQLALGDPPTDPALTDSYQQAYATLQRVQDQLELRPHQIEPVHPPVLPATYDRLFGEQRTATLRDMLATEHNRVQTLTDAELHALIADDIGAALDRSAAQHALRLEREHDHHRQTAHHQADRAALLEAQAQQLGWRHRDERAQLRHDAALHREHAARHTADAERIDLDLDRLHATDLHPDHWLAHHGQQLATQLAAAAEIDRRNQHNIHQQAELAITHSRDTVLALIGDRPRSDARLAQHWEHLATQIERHRLTDQLEPNPDQPLGLDHSAIPASGRAAHHEQRDDLAHNIQRYRQAAGLPEHARSVQDAERHQLEHEL